MQEGLSVQSFFFFVPLDFANRSSPRLAIFVAWLLVMLMFAGFFENTGLLKLLFEALQCAVKRFVRPHDDLGQFLHPPAYKIMSSRCV